MPAPEILKVPPVEAIEHFRAKGRWERIERVADDRPWLRYFAVRDGRTRPDHLAWHGTAEPAQQVLEDKIAAAPADPADAVRRDVLAALAAELVALTGPACGGCGQPLA